MRTRGVSPLSAPRLRVETFDASLACPFPLRLSSTTDKLMNVRPSTSNAPHISRQDYWA